MKRISFRNYMLLLALVPAIVVALVLSGIYISWNHHEVEMALKERARAMARQLGTAAEYNIFSGSRENLRSLADAAQKGDREILSVAILDERGQLLAQVGDSLSGSPIDLGLGEQTIDKTDRIQILMPVFRTVVPLDDVYAESAITEKRTAQGYVLLDISRQRLIKSRNKQMLIGLNIALAGLVLGVWLALRMSRGVTQPLSHVIEVVDRIGHGDIHARVDAEQTRLFESLADNINAMAERTAMAKEDLQQQIALATEELILRKEEAEKLARIDGLTNIPNRRAFMQAAEQEVLRAQRYDMPLSVAILDLDHFKTINDTYGHGVGDQVLVSRAGLLAAAIREVDLIGRLGGEEFGILMPGTPLGEAIQAVERMRQMIEQSPVGMGGQLIRSTASFGVAEYPGDDPTVDSLLAKADDALYLAKARGRNRVEAPAQKKLEGL